MAEDKKKEIDVAVIEVTEEYLKEKLYKIRGKRVLLDADLAEIYGYDTKGFNRQVKNNIEKFDEDFMFELTDEELEDLRYKNCTANISSKSRYNPEWGRKAPLGIQKWLHFAPPFLKSGI